MLQTCLELRRRLGNPIDIAATLSTLSVAQLAMGDATSAREGEQEALAIFRKSGDQVGEAIGLLHLGQVAQHLDNETEAVARLEESLAIAHQIKHREIEGECELVLGQVAFEGGDLDLARDRLKRSLAICQDAADKRGAANALWWLAKVDLEDRAFNSAGTRLGVDADVSGFEMR
jgi:tetratricopeptide (TPR) repeat protein